MTALTAWHTTQLAIRLTATDWEETDLLFATQHRRVITQRYSQAHLARTIAAIGIKTVAPHGIRHTAATLMLERGIHIMIVSDLLGHQDITTMPNLYSHVSPELQRLAVETLDRAIYDAEETA